MLNFPDDEGASISQVEGYKSGVYEPARDVKGVGSRILVAYMDGAPAEKGSLSGKWEGHLEVLASLGASWNWEVGGDEGAARQTLTNALISAKKPDGLYVLHGRMIGGGEDCEFDVDEIRPLSSEERRWVQANFDFSGVIHLWAREYREVPCYGCKKPLDHHKEYEMKCPENDEEAKAAKVRWEEAWSTIEEEGK